MRELMAYPFVEDFIYHLPSKAVRLAGAIHAWMYDEPERYPIEHYTTQAAIELAESTIHHAAFALAPSGLALTITPPQSSTGWNLWKTDRTMLM